MKAMVRVELRGDSTVQMSKLYRNLTNDILPGVGDMFYYPPAAWVAEITGADPKYKYARHFFKFKKDYRKSNSVGSRGIYAEYILESGKIYEVKEHKKRYFCTVNDDGDIIKMSESEVQEWIRNQSELMSAQPPKSE